MTFIMGMKWGTIFNILLIFFVVFNLTDYIITISYIDGVNVVELNPLFTKLVHGGHFILFFIVKFLLVGILMFVTSHYFYKSLNVDSNNLYIIFFGVLFLSDLLLLVVSIRGLFIGYSVFL